MFRPRVKPRHRREHCHITEEWCGLFIGRRYCSTHNVRWDEGGDCPRNN